MRVSTIIPTYNRAAWLGGAIDSVLSQMLPGDELIVVDDGSTDETPALLAGYGSRLIVVQGAHKGAGRARNLGIARARNELVAFLDSDDQWLAHKLALQRAYMERRPEVLFSFTNFQVCFRDGTVVPRYLDRWSRPQATWEQALGPGVRYSGLAPLPGGIEDFAVYEADLYPLQLAGFYVLTDTLVVRRREAAEALRFAEDLPTYEDLECFYALSRKGRGALLDADLALQRDHADGRLSQRGQGEKLDARIVLLRRFWGADADFLAHGQAEYRSALEELLLQRAGLLLTQGDNRGARATLAEVGTPALHLRMLSALPGWLTRACLSLRRRVVALR